jgi:hypothetical protein
LSLAVFVWLITSRVGGFPHTVSKGADGRAPIHAAPLMGPPRIVSLEVIDEHGLHFLNGFKLGVPSLNPEMLVEQGAVEAFKVAGRATLVFCV